METRSGFDPSNMLIFKIPFFEKKKRLGGGGVANVLEKRRERVCSIDAFCVARGELKAFSDPTSTGVSLSAFIMHGGKRAALFSG